MKRSQEINDIWTSRKELNTFLEDVVVQPVHGVLKQLEEVLRTHKHDFCNLLSNPPKNAEDRDEIKDALTNYAALPGIRHHLITKEVVAETLILSDMFDLNEYVALDLLITAQQQMPYHPSLPRGLVAVVLYYDARKCLVSSLKTLVQSRKGITWTLNTSEEILRYVTWYTEDILDHQLFSKIIDLLETIDVMKEIDLLQQNRALGGPRHHRQVEALIQDTRQGLAEVLFCWSAQCGLPRHSTLLLIGYIKSYKSEDDAAGIIDNVAVTLTVALLYALDLSVMHTKDDGEEIVKTLPLLTDPEFAPALMKECLVVSKTPWETPGLQGIMHLAWTSCLSTLRLINAEHIVVITDEDDLLVDSANELNVFDFLHCSFLPNRMIYTEEFYMRRIHSLITDFIALMPMKVKEMKNRSDESSRTIQAYEQEGLDPPTGLPHHFENLLLTVSRFYEKDPLNLELSLDFWATEASSFDSEASYRYLPRQVALFKFVRLGADMLSPTAFVPYMKMLRSLASTTFSARQAFTFMKSNMMGGSPVVTWNHFFWSLDKYHTTLRREVHPFVDQPRNIRRGILPQEIQGLQAVLGVIQAVAEHDPASRVGLCECTSWNPVSILIGLVACAVPIPLKAELLFTLAALARAPGIAKPLWYSLESSKILTSISASCSFQPRGVQTELTEVETCNEEFPLTRAVLYLLDVLTDIPVPRLLGIETRAPGFVPYLDFIEHTVFLRFNVRSYRDPGEKWVIAEGCLILLKKFLKKYIPMFGDFFTQRVQLQTGERAMLNPLPGYRIMLSMNTKSATLRLILSLIDEGANALDIFSDSPSQSKVQATILSCLQMLEYALALQDEFCGLLTRSGCSFLVAGLRQLLLDVNPRTCKPDHLLNITKYVVHSNWLPHHALSAVKILLSVCCTPSGQNHLLSLYTSSPELSLFIRHGFVECIEGDEDDPLPKGCESEDRDGVTVQGATKEVIFRLLQQSLPYSSPNISHYLFGFDLKRVHETVFQQPGALGFPRTCLHSLLSLLDGSLMKRAAPYTSGPHGSILDTAYCMLYMLCSDSKTSGPVLRFLRSCGDFVYRHVSHLPFVGVNKTSEIVQMSWLLKIVAVELKSVSRNDQISVLNNMVNLLTREFGDAPEDPDNQETSESGREENLSQYLSRKDRHDDMKATKQRMLLALLNILDLEVAVCVQPNWEFFVPKELTQLSARCVVKYPGDQKFIDVKKIHNIMLEQLASLQGSNATQRTMVINEIQRVLKYFIELNRQKAYSYATMFYMEAWCQVTEILFCVCPQSVLPEDLRLGLLVDCLNAVLKKMRNQQVMPELGAIASGSILLLSVALQQNLLARQQKALALITSANSSSTLTNTLSSDASFCGPGATDNSLNVPGRPAIFDTVLSNILEWVLNSGVSSQKLRTHLYGALLMFVRMVSQDSAQKKAVKEVERLRSKDSLHVTRSSERCFPGPEPKVPQQINLAVIMGFGESLIDILCHDCTGSHDICKMLALSCLGLLIEVDPQNKWISYIHSRGYLKHIIDSILDSNEELVNLFGVQAKSLSPLFVYEAKMAMLCRIGSKVIGADLVVEQGIFGCLASMSVFDKHPDFKPNFPNVDATYCPITSIRFQQILFPALNLCDALLATLGPDHATCTTKVRAFLYSHYEMLSIILRCGSPLMQTRFLEEVARITGLIARVTRYDARMKVLETNKLSEKGKQHSSHVQTWMLELMRHFLLSENVLRELRDVSKAPAPGVTNVSSTKDCAQPRSERAVLHFLQVACNLMVFARNITNRRLDRRATRPIFSIHVEDIFSEGGKKRECEGIPKKNFICPPLGLVVEQLILGVSCHQREKNNLDLLKHKKTSISTSAFAMDVSEVLLESVRDGGNATDARARWSLEKVIELKRLELEHCAFLIDNCLYLIWSHLDFYLYQAELSNKESLSTITPTGGSDILKISQEDLNSLKESLMCIFSDTFSKKLLEIHQERSATDIGFIEALLKRIRRLIQLTPSEENLEEPVFTTV